MPMIPKFKIRHLDEALGQIVVEADGIEAPFAIDLPVDENGDTLEPGELNQYIRGFIPTFELERRLRVKRGIRNIAKVRELVEPPPPPTPPPTPPLRERRVRMKADAFQLREALADLGRLEAIEQWIDASTDASLGRYWRHTPVFNRNAPAMLEIAKGVGISMKDLDEIFQQAGAVDDGFPLVNPAEG